MHEDRVTGWGDVKAPALFSHRGIGLGHRENTVQAFGAALAAGADVLETDVRVTQDGRVVILHDLFVRFRGRRRRPEGLTLAQLMETSPNGGQSAGILLLSEALKKFQGALFNVEIKSPRLTAVDTVKLQIENSRACQRVLLTSFWPCHNPHLVEAKYPWVGLGWGELFRSLTSCRGREGARVQLPYSLFKHGSLGKKYIKRMKERSAFVDLYGVNDKRAAQTAVALGVDGIITDSVCEVAAVLREREPAEHGRKK